MVRVQLRRAMEFVTAYGEASEPVGIGFVRQTNGGSMVVATSLWGNTSSRWLSYPPSVFVICWNNGSPDEAGTPQHRIVTEDRNRTLTEW